MKGIRVIKLSSLFIFVLSCVSVGAAAPANDNFANAQTVVDFSTYFTTNALATKEASEPQHALNAGGKSVWYKYVAGHDGFVSVTTEGSAFDTTLAVYRGFSFDELTLVAASDDIGPGTLQSRLEFATMSGFTYYIAVDGHNTDGVTASGQVMMALDRGGFPSNNAFANAITLSQTGGELSVSNVGATKEFGEPNHANDPGGHSVWYRLVGPAGTPRSFTFSTRGSTNQFGTASMPTLLAVYTGVSVGNLTQLAADNGFAQVTFIPSPGAVYYIAIDSRFFDTPALAQGTITLKYGVTGSTQAADFDRDSKADISVFRPSNGTWYSLDSITGDLREVRWGLSSDIPLAGDFDFDQYTDQAVFRPSSGDWYVNRSKPPLGLKAFHWGVAGDIPQVFKDGPFSYVAVFRPSNGTWYIRFNDVFPPIKFGLPGDVPVAADYDGDGTSDVAVFRPSTGVWYRINSSNQQVVVRQFGVSGDKPVVGDYDNDGRADLALYRPSTGTWWILRSYTNIPQAVQWGIAEDIPQVADYDGDNRADLAVFRPSNNTWYILQSSSGTPRFIQFGLSGDIPVTASNFVR